MSRIGKKPIQIPAGVTVSCDGHTVSVKGPKGALSERMPQYITFSQEGAQVVFTRASESKTARANHGLIRALTANMVTGVSTGFTRSLKILGVGYRASVSGQKLTLTLGYSHPVVFNLPDGVTATVSKPGTELTVSGSDKCVVGQVAATIRGFRAPDSYKGKGVRYADEEIRLKAGKSAR